MATAEKLGVLPPPEHRQRRGQQHREGGGFHAAGGGTGAAADEHQNHGDALPGLAEGGQVHGVKARRPGSDGLKQ